MGALKIGWAEENITPDRKISLAGQFAERISQYVEKPLTVTAMAIEKDGEQAVIVSCDLGAVAWNLVEAVRERLADNGEGLDPGKVMMAAIHTHTGPVYVSKRRITKALKLDEIGGTGTIRQQLEAYLPKDKKYVEKENISDNPDIFPIAETLDFLADRIAKAALTAWKERTEGSFSNAFGRAAVGMCRRVTYNDGSAQMWGDTNTAVFEAVEGGNDSGIELLFVYNGEKLTGIAANIACPAQCVQHRLFVSPDFWGEVKVRLRAYFGKDLFLLPLCSAAGDQCPVDMVRWVTPESDVHDPNIEHPHPLRRKADPSMFDLSGMKVAGRRIAQEITAVFEDGLDPVQQDPVFRHEVVDIQLPLRRATLADKDRAERALKEYFRETDGDVDFNDVAKMQVNLGILERFKLQEKVNVIDTEVHIMRLGTVAFATNPFELFLDYGNQIRVRSKAEQTFLIQLCNGSEGYLPTKKAEEGGHYSAFISSGQIGHIGGDQLVRESLQRINALFPEE
ncbi:MAG: hypothetical protein IJJ50_08435 [Lachnospiraceae bacterium]|nr:hypothetical protein [Lachnospiraceae bacterium]